MKGACMADFFNKIDGSKLVIFYSFTLALAAVVFLGLRIVIVDGSAVSSEIAYLEQIVDTILYVTFGISSFHVGVGAISGYKQKKLEAQQQQQQQQRVSDAKEV